MDRTDGRRRAGEMTERTKAEKARTGKGRTEKGRTEKYGRRFSIPKRLPSGLMNMESDPYRAPSPMKSVQKRRIFLTLSYLLCPFSLIPFSPFIY